MSPSWEQAQQAVAMEKGSIFTHPKKILLFPGLVRTQRNRLIVHHFQICFHPLQLSEYSAYDFANNAFKVRCYYFSHGVTMVMYMYQECAPVCYRVATSVNWFNGVTLFQYELKIKIAVSTLVYPLPHLFPLPLSLPLPPPSDITYARPSHHHNDIT